MQNNKKLSAGFGIIEVIVAMGIFVIIAVTGVSTVTHSFSINRLSEETSTAHLFAQEGIEAARSIRNQDWTDMVAGTHGVSNAGNAWSFSGSNNISGKYTRQITVAQGQRDGSGNIVDSGGSADSDLVKVTSEVSWDFSPTRANNVTLETYFTNFIKSIIGDWSTPALQTDVNLAGNTDGNKVAYSGNYAYVVRSSTPNFIVIDVSNPASPSEVGSLTLANTPLNIFISGTVAYVASDSNSAELQIVNIATPASPALLGSYNATGNANANGVYAVGTTVYVVRASSGDNEFLIVNAATPATPSLVGSVNLGATGLEVYVSGSTAYVASDSNSQELQVVNITTPATPSISGSLNLAGNDNALTISGFGQTVVLGRVGGNFNTINVTTPASPSLLGTLNVGDTINDISLGNNNTYAFLATNSNSAEFQVLNIATLATPVSLGSYNIAGNEDLDGIVYNPDQDRAYVVGSSNSSEFMIIEP